MFGLVAVLAVALTASLTFGAGWQALSQLDPQLVAGYERGGVQNAPPLSAAQTQALDQIFRSFGSSAWQAGLLASLLAFIASALLARQLARPLLRLEDAATRVAGGERGVRLPLPRANDELRTVTAAFNTLSQGLERQEAWRRSLMADVAHDLRTPLAVLRAEIEAIQDGLNAPDAASLSRLHAEVLLLARLVGDLRTLSLAEGNALTLHPERLDAGQQLRQLAGLFAGRVQEAGSQLSLHLPAEALPVRVDPDRLMQILHNLLDNALRYAAPSHIELGAEQGYGPDLSGGSVGLAQTWQVRLWVRDHGPGFSPDTLSRAFERFYRADASRTRGPQGEAGSGLGLAIARALAETQGGTLSAANHQSGGAVFTLSLPTG